MDILKYSYFKVSPRISYRYLALVGFSQGEFSLAEFLNLLLPGSMKNPETLNKFQHFFDRYHDQHVRPFIASDGSFNLYGHPFYTTLYPEGLILIQQVIASDQYETKKFVKDGDIVIDAGANIGTFSVKVAHDFPRAAIYAIEPSAETFGLLQKNTLDYSQVTCVNAGLGEKEDKKELAKYRNQHGTARIDGASLAPHDPKYGEIILETVTITTIDALVRQKNIPRVDFIKMDTEGYEAKILKGAAETIKKWKPVIVMSAYHAPNDKTELPELLKSIRPDYVCELHREAEEDFVCYVP